MNSDFKIPIEEQRKIYHYLWGVFQEGVAYNSPLRNDNNPSFNIYNNGEGKLVFKDFGSGESGDVFDFIQLKRDEIKNVGDAISFYESRIKNSCVTAEVVESLGYSSSGITKKKVTPIPVDHDSFFHYELDYYKRFGITENDLVRKEVFPLLGINWSDGKRRPGSTVGNPAFIWDCSEFKDMSSWKAYYPLHPDKKRKWLSWNLSSIPGEGWYILPKRGEELIISSSYKDGMVIEKCYNNTWCFNPTGETAYRKIVSVAPELRTRFDNVYILYDGDEAGLTASKRLSEMTGFKALNLNYPKFSIKTRRRLKAMGIGRTHTKDVAEIVQEYDYRVLKRLINKAKSNV